VVAAVSEALASPLEVGFVTSPLGPFLSLRTAGYTCPSSNVNTLLLVSPTVKRCFEPASPKTRSPDSDNPRLFPPPMAQDSSFTNLPLSAMPYSSTALGDKSCKMSGKMLLAALICYARS